MATKKINLESSDHRIGSARHRWRRRVGGIQIPWKRRPRHRQKPPHGSQQHSFRMIDGKTECLRLAIRLQNDGKFYYNIEINKITS